MSFTTTRVRKSYAQIPDILDVPNLLQTLQDSYRWFQEEGIKELFNEIAPIKDYSGSLYELSFPGYEFGEPKYSEQECQERDLTYAAPLKVKVQLLVKETGEIKEQEVFLGDIPLLTERATFIINGAERAVVSQLTRSPGIYFSIEEDITSGRELCSAKLIPERGAWLELETSNQDLLSVKIERRHKFSVTTLLRTIGYGTNDELLQLFSDIDTDPEHPYIKHTIEHEPAINDKNQALFDFYRYLRPGDPPTLGGAEDLIDALLFNSRRYDLGEVGRYKLNKRLGLNLPLNNRALTKEDLVAIVRHIIMVNNGMDTTDDIDHLGNRRVQTVGKLLQNQLRIGLLRLERIVKERMSLVTPESATPGALVNNRPIVAAIREFFGSSQLSQFMDQTNPLAELTHKRRLSSLGPGGLSRERAGFEVRDIHHSHYGRICPIETPEGPNIGLITSPATYARVNQFGFIETPYRKVIKELENTSAEIEGKRVRETIFDTEDNILIEAGMAVTAEVAQRLAELPLRSIKIEPFASTEMQYLSADEEEHYTIAQANVPLDEAGQFRSSKVDARHGKKFVTESPQNIDFMDISPKQIVSVTTSLIPFLEHDDANRALMGSNMQRQAVPLLRPQAPIVATGMERVVARDSAQVLFAQAPGEVTSVTAERIVVQEDEGGEHVYPLVKFARTNQGTCFSQHPIVSKGGRVLRGQVLADSISTDQGELALGQNLLCAFLSWEGYNFEDAIVISQSLVRDERLSSIHIERYEIEARETKLGPEEITRDIPSIGEESLRNLDEHGIIRVGAVVKPGDILVGKIVPKGERMLTAEEKLLRAIFGEKARDVKDASLRMPHGESGKVIEVRVFSRDNHDQLPPGVNQMVRVFVTHKRNVTEGDKLSGRHGNKGVIAKILPIEDMPFLPDGRPVDIILNPLGVPSRMNVGQLLETHLGWAAHTLDFEVLSPVFDGADDIDIEDTLAQAWIAQRSGAIGWQDGKEVLQIERAKSWLDERGYDGERIFSNGSKGDARMVCLRLWLEEQAVDTSMLTNEEVEQTVNKLCKEKREPPPTFGKTTLYDGQTGEPFEQPVTVGYIYMMKLIHLAEEKIHARSTGPYSLITQQPLGGKAQHGGQRFGEMEVWALEAYGAAHTLQEMLTIKSDDVIGRLKTYEAIVKGIDISMTGIPESFKVLFYELRSLGLAIEVLSEGENVPLLQEEAPRLGINLSGLELGESD
jgi:DNA-directed RNA polymerase subunit beta